MLDKSLFIILIALCSLATPLTTVADVQAADVQQAVARLSIDMDQVRRHQNKPEPRTLGFKVLKAKNRHVYFHLQTLFRKINRLARESANTERIVPLPAPDREITAEDLLALVQQSQAQLGLTLQAFGIAPTGKTVERQRRVKPKDLMQAVIFANQHASQLLDTTFQPKDVYRQLTLSSQYVDGVLKNLNVGAVTPTTPAFREDAQPFEVLLTLGRCLGLNEKIGKKIKVPVIVLTAVNNDAEETPLSAEKAREEVAAQLRSARLVVNYETATLLMADISYWTARLESDPEPIGEPPAQITTPNVLQKALLLEAQLTALLQHL